MLFCERFQLLWQQPLTSSACEAAEKRNCREERSILPPQCSAWAMSLRDISTCISEGIHWVLQGKDLMEEIHWLRAIWFWFNHMQYINSTRLLCMFLPENVTLKMVIKQPPGSPLSVYEYHHSWRVHRMSIIIRFWRGDFAHVYCLNFFAIKNVHVSWHFLSVFLGNMIIMHMCYSMSVQCNLFAIEAGRCLFLLITLSFEQYLCKFASSITIMPC